MSNPGSLGHCGTGALAADKVEYLARLHRGLADELAEVEQVRDAGMYDVGPPHRRSPTHQPGNRPRALKKLAKSRLSSSEKNRPEA